MIRVILFIECLGYIKFVFFRCLYNFLVLYIFLVRECEYFFKTRLVNNMCIDKFFFCSFLMFYLVEIC